MWGQLTAYWLLIQAGFWRQSRYRLAMAAGLFTNTVFGCVRVAVLLAAVRSAGGFGGYDEGGISAYVWLSQALLGSIQLTAARTEISERIHNGDIAVDFIRPLGIQEGYLAGEFGRAVFSLLPRGVPAVLIGWLTFGLALPTAAAPYLLGLLSIALAILLSILAHFALGLIGFWIVETRGIRSLYAVTGTFFAGLYVPVHVLPSWLRAVANATPFPSMLQAPIDVFSGYATGLEAVNIVAVQVIWLVVVATAGQLLLRAGRQKLEVQGG